MNKNWVYFSPEGIPGIYNEKPEGYFTPEEWEALHPPIPQEPQEPTPQQIQKNLTDAVQIFLDRGAKERGYDNIHTACTYAPSTDPIFKAEALICVAWRDIVWRTCYNILDEVMTGQREIPTVEELIAELPKLVWPE